MCDTALTLIVARYRPESPAVPSLHPVFVIARSRQKPTTGRVAGRLTLQSRVQTGEIAQQRVAMGIAAHAARL